MNHKKNIATASNYNDILFGSNYSVIRNVFFLEENSMIPFSKIGSQRKNRKSKKQRLTVFCNKIICILIIQYLQINYTEINYIFTIFYLESIVF